MILQDNATEFAIGNAETKRFGHFAFIVHDSQLWTTIILGGKQRAVAIDKADVPALKRWLDTFVSGMTP